MRIAESLYFGADAIQLELRTLDGSASYARLAAIMVIAASWFLWRTAALAKSEESVAQFEEESPMALLTHVIMSGDRYAMDAPY